MKILLNYANDAYRKSQKWNSWTGKHIAGFDKVYEFSPADIEEDYYLQHKDVLDEKRGNGLWLWKPYFIDRVMDTCKEGDIIFYADSGSFFLKKVDNLISSLRENEKIWVSDYPLLESCFTKPTCFEKMDCENEEIRKLKQLNELEEKVENAIGVIYRKKYSKFFKELEEKDAIKLIEIFSKYINI